MRHWVFRNRSPMIVIRSLYEIVGSRWFGQQLYKLWAAILFETTFRPVLGQLSLTIKYVRVKLTTYSAYRRGLELVDIYVHVPLR